MWDVRPGRSVQESGSTIAAGTEKMAPRTKKAAKAKEVTRYVHEDALELATPETGHTALLAEEQAVTLAMDNGWADAVKVGRLPGSESPVIIDMDPAYDPVLFWAGKRNHREVPLVPLQRNEIVREPRIAAIIARARERAASKREYGHQRILFAELEKTLRESEKQKRVKFYTHEKGWKNKLICGDSLQLMESLIHYDGLRGKVQMIYVDPPYGISYDSDSNFQQRIDTNRNDPKDQAYDILTVRAYRDTWSLGIHSYLSYLHERLYLCRELLAESVRSSCRSTTSTFHGSASCSMRCSARRTILPPSCSARPEGSRTAVYRVSTTVFCGKAKTSTNSSTAISTSPNPSGARAQASTPASSCATALADG